MLVSQLGEFAMSIISETEHTEYFFIETEKKC